MSRIDNLNSKNKEYITCAAVYYDNGVSYPEGVPTNITSGFVVCGYRPSDCFYLAARLIVNLPERYYQGFLTSKNKFVSRQEAAKIAYDAGQLKHLKEQPKTLISEDLY